MCVMFSWAVHLDCSMRATSLRVLKRIPVKPEIISLVLLSQSNMTLIIVNTLLADDFMMLQSHYSPLKSLPSK